MRSFLLSALQQRHLGQGLDVFTRAFPAPWLVWEPGTWKPPGHHTVMGLAVEDLIKASHGPSSAAAEALAYALEPRTDGQPLTVGRAPQCDASINDGTLSSVHLLVAQRPDGAWQVQDQGSRNGTLVDGAPLPRQVWLPLRDGMRIKAAQVSLSYLSPQGMLQRLGGRSR